MKEGIEQLKKEPEEKSVLEEIWEIKKREEAIREEDPRYGTAWNVIDPDKLTPEALEFYELYKAKNLNDAAKAKIRAFRESLEAITDKGKRETNREFLGWLDDEIGREFLRNQLKSEQEQDFNR